MIARFSSKRKQNFGLSEAKFDELVSRLREGDESIFETVFVSQANNCIKILQKRYRANYENAYDATMDALLEFRIKLLTGKFKYGNLRYLFNRMAQFRYLKSTNRMIVDRDQDLVDFDLVEQKYDSLTLLKLKKIWSQLSNDEQRILYLRYDLGAKLVDIAQNMGLTEEAVRKRKQRILVKIKSQLSNE